jgi:hypothetical protein
MPSYPLNMTVGGPQGRSERSGGEKNHLPLPGFEPRIVQPVAWSLSDCAVLAHLTVAIAKYAVIRQCLHELCPA